MDSGLGDRQRAGDVAITASGDDEPACIHERIYTIFGYHQSITRYAFRSRRQAGFVQIQTTRVAVGKGKSMPMTWMKERLTEVGKRPIDLARHLNIPPSRVYEMLKGERRIQPREIPLIATFLNMTSQQIVGHLNVTDATPPVPVFSADAPLGPLVVWRGARGGDGGWIVFNEVAGEVARQDFLAFSKSAFATMVIDALNEPVYRVRDRIVIDPASPCAIGDDCFLMNAPETVKPGDGTPAIMGRLVKEEAQHWQLEQYASPGKPIRVPKSKCGACFPIVGRYLGR
jgi:hypothetical protein